MGLREDSHRDRELGTAGHVLSEAAVPAGRGGGCIADCESVVRLVDGCAALCAQLRGGGGGGMSLCVSVQQA